MPEVGSFEGLSAAGSLVLAGEFPRRSHEDWARLAERALKGATIEDALVSRTAEGLRIEPLYEKAAHPAGAPWRRHGRWKVAQRVDHPDPGEARALALTDLQGGADSLTLVGRAAPSARGFGLDLGSAAVLDQALEGVELDLIHLRLDAGADGIAAADALVNLAAARGHALSSLDIDLGLDPIGALAASGRWPATWAMGFEEGCGRACERFREHGHAGAIFLADERPFHEAGAGEAQALAAVVAAAVRYLRALGAGGVPPDMARGAVSFLLVADADEFLTIAKFRALRLLWARVEEACGLSPAPPRIHAETAWRMMAAREPSVNMLRGTLAAFSAVAGGADTLTVLPFTAAIGLPDALARRVARNTQLVLMEEANIWRVADPAAGSGGFEALTDALAARAWSGFQAIEREGGVLAALRGGSLQRGIAATRAARETAIATKAAPITGVTIFASPDGPQAPVLPWPATRPSLEAGEVEPLPSRRDAAPFERLPAGAGP